MPHPRALLTWSAAALAAGLLSTNPWHRALLLGAALNVSIALRRHDSTIAPLLAGLGFATVIALFINIVASHAGVHVLVVLPSPVQGFGGPVTLESIVYGATTALGIAAALSAAAPVALVLEGDDLVDALPRRLERTGAAVGSALTLIPRLMRSVSDIRDAQRLRGLPTASRAGIHTVLLPALLTAVEDSVQLAEAMEVRGFGGAPRQRWRSAPLSVADIAVMTAAVTAIGLAVVARWSGTLIDWYPFPAVTTPAVPLVSVVVAVLLLVPVFVWRAP